MSNVTKYKLLVKNLPMNFCQERLISVLKIHGITDIYKIIIRVLIKIIKPDYQ